MHLARTRPIGTRTAIFAGPNKPDRSATREEPRIRRFLRHWQVDIVRCPTQEGLLLHRGRNPASHWTSATLEEPASRKAANNLVEKATAGIFLPPAIQWCRVSEQE